MPEIVTCTANGEKTYDVAFDGDEIAYVEVVQERVVAGNPQRFKRRMWTRGRGTFGSPRIEAAKRAARAVKESHA
ncbi:hypothetical protein BAJUN_01270 [Bajunvirus bajun]|uniref:Uncharacterized protein n=1 Tax=Brevundimonas phage vB_BgoS-Bajun TaxID=2948594 RepID=A0A9E7N791_9CAUD|nr:hypothetical protein BAJUN_01270 [Brevundimonas phage vB_BgoS-Bajun]